MSDPLDDSPLRAKIRFGSILVGETILLALSSAAAYAIAFAYEVGAADHFGYPPWLIQVDFRGALLTWGVLLWLVLAVAQIISPLVKDLSPQATHVLAGWLPYFAPWLLVIAFFTYQRRAWALVAVAAFFALQELFTLVLRPLWSKKYTGRVLDRWEKALQRSEDKSPSVAEPLQALLKVGGLRRWMGLAWLSLALFLVTLFMARAVGAFRAGAQNYFLVRGDPPRQRIALRRFGDQVIAAEFDPYANEIVCRYTVLPLVDHQGDLWTLQKVEPPKVVMPSRRQGCS